MSKNNSPVTKNLWQFNLPFTIIDMNTQIRQSLSTKQCVVIILTDKELMNYHHM